MLVCNCSLAGTKACLTCPSYIAEFGMTQTTDYNNYIFTSAPNTAPPDGLADPWKHRSEGMRCSTCMWYVKKTAEGVNKEVGRCRRHSPSMNGYPVVYSDDWCGDHKVDETKV